jgi:putative colanic acid biosynthesis glycosyltransferase
MKVLQVNTTAGTGSHGKIAGEIGRLLHREGHQGYLGYGRGVPGPHPVPVRIGGRVGMLSHLLRTRLLDEHGMGSLAGTRKFLGRVAAIQPDIIHLHNIHGYYLHVGLLFEFLKEYKKPVVWTLHDCWAFTGHCSHFDRVNCDRWKTRCFSCPNRRGYPASWLSDHSTKNFAWKKELVTGLDRLVFVTPSRWLENHLKDSFLREYPVRVIPNGVDLGVFNSSAGNKRFIRDHHLEGKSVILGVANRWDSHKGLDDFSRLAARLSGNDRIVLVGAGSRRAKNLPGCVMWIGPTGDMAELAAIYAAADVFINPTYADNFPTTNIEALACGTPVITYNTGGSPEAIDAATGVVLEKGDIPGMLKAISEIRAKGAEMRLQCEERAARLYNGNERYREYLSLYDELLNQGP